MAYFYIIYSKEKDRYYVGSTRRELEERIKKHKSKHRGYTSIASDWELVYSEYYSTYEEAYKRERAVKGLKSRAKIEELIGRV